MIDDQGSHTPSRLTMRTYTAFHHAHPELQKNKGVHPKAAKSMLKADRPDRSNYFNHKNDGGKTASCRAATGCKLLTSPDIADT
jgi:hypothetical protein